MIEDDLNLPFTVPPDRIEPGEFNLKETSESLGKVLRNNLREVITGFDGALALIAEEISPALVTSVAIGDAELTSELEAQLALLLHIQELKLSEIQWKTMQAIVSTAMGALSAGLLTLNKGLEG
jgi:predicted component of type VI protein secretion system